MAWLSKRKQSIKEVTQGRERQRKVRKTREERGWESPEVEEDVVAPGFLQRSVADSAPDSESEESENDGVLVGEGEEVGESAFGKLMASAVEQSRCVWFLKRDARTNYL